MVPAPSTAALRITVAGARSVEDTPAASGLIAVSTLIRITPIWNYAQLTTSLPGNQPLRQSTRELTGNFFRGQGAIGFIPHTNPVQRTGDGKRGNLGIARGNRSILDSFLDERSQTAIDLSFVGPHLGARVAGEIKLIHAHYAPCEVDRHGGGIRVDKCL